MRILPSGKLPGIQSLGSFVPVGMLLCSSELPACERLVL